MIDLEAIRERHRVLPDRGGSADIGALLAEVDRLRADVDLVIGWNYDLRAQVDRVKALSGGPFGDGCQPYAVEVDGEVILAVGLDDLRAALDGTD